MSNDIPKSETFSKPLARTTGLSPKEQKLNALREKMAAQQAKASGAKHTGASDFAKGKVSTTGARKTAFQRKAT
jgi:hypothetical protein